MHHGEPFQKGTPGGVRDGVQVPLSRVFPRVSEPELTPDGAPCHTCLIGTTARPPGS